MAALNVTPLSGKLSVAGQICRDDLPAIAAAGFKSIVCNRPDGESPDQVGWHSLASAARQAGLAMAYLPVVSGRVTAEHGREFGALLDRLPAPVFAYCRSGMRSATLWALSQLDSQPWPQLVQLAAQAGFNLKGMTPPNNVSL